jgi:hypothetical protein
MDAGDEELLGFGRDIVARRWSSSGLILS